MRDHPLPLSPLRDPAVRWIAWRRHRDQNESWQPLPHTEAQKHTDVYNLCADEELKAGDTDWEYVVMPVGMTPEERPESPKQTYLNRMMWTRR